MRCGVVGRSDRLQRADRGPHGFDFRRFHRSIRSIVVTLALHAELIYHFGMDRPAGYDRERLARSLRFVCTVEEDDVDALDALARRRKTTRSALVREAIRRFLGTELIHPRRDR